ncbi:hypothetical protein F5Y12DRAFT_386131 [Xylaria sp. FL1777]|nr:hypothetical protein F5Y12DRAFT_386131 [Xylaria sp. FL1777]
MEARPPRPDWSVEHEWHWPCWKFGMGLDELFTTLHNQFNTWPAPIQDFKAFHSDVWEISNIASTKEELFRALESRKKQRSEEMAQAWNDIALHLTAGSSMLPDEQWGHATQFFRTKSLDAMLSFLYTFLTDEEKVTVYNYLNGKEKKAVPAIGSEGIHANEDQVDLEAVQAEAVQADAVTSSQGEQALQSPAAGARNREDQAHDTGLIPPPDPISSSLRQSKECLGTLDSVMEEVAFKTTRRKKRNSKPLPASTNPSKAKPGRHKSRDRISKPGSCRSPRVNAKERPTKEPSTTRSRYNLRSNASRGAG